LRTRPTVSLAISSLYVCMAIKHIIVFLFVETPRKFITAKLSIRNIFDLLYIKRARELNKSHITRSYYRKESAA
jgi:hypothetical protein